MYKYILILFVVAQFNWATASAEWLLIDGNDELKLEVFVDIDSIEKTNNKARIWSLYNAKELHKVQGRDIHFKSYKFFAEYDCDQRKYRPLATHYFKESMAKGVPIARALAANFSADVDVGTIDETIFNKVCGLE